MSKPIATVMVDPVGPLGADPREHAVKVLLKLSPGDPTFSDNAHVAAVARKAISCLPLPMGRADRRHVDEVTVSSKMGKTGVVRTVVVGIEGSVVVAGRPASALIEGLRDVLEDEGYRVALRERRECHEPGCKGDAVTEWDRLSELPAGWHDSAICGQHNYRTCTRCKSLYVMTSVNAAGQAPSVHCEVCGLVMVEWGSSKVWTAELVKRASWTPPAARN